MYCHTWIIETVNKWRVLYCTKCKYLHSSTFRNHICYFLCHSNNCEQARFHLGPEYDYYCHLFSIHSYFGAMFKILPRFQMSMCYTHILMVLNCILWTFEMYTEFDISFLYKKKLSNFICANKSICYIFERYRISRLFDDFIVDLQWEFYFYLF